jgi:hypothetical protein
MERDLELLKARSFCRRRIAVAFYRPAMLRAERARLFAFWGSFGIPERIRSGG